MGRAEQPVEKQSPTQKWVGRSRPTHRRVATLGRQRAWIIGRALNGGVRPRLKPHMSLEEFPVRRQNAHLALALVEINAYRIHGRLASRFKVRLRVA
jgi:hypothetical protein